ncbi:protein zinc induced facilitator-like 1 [Anaeramoeba ignava]|uniref:Protein zinc induced facilitator-like 1 n=1 Tax=Anaeramoeba ignava TaxID=1746090 RepID=A0A9Q0LTB5_ANAIG|nr:protein zinc induced facilitator-like 1 [Anaeramoeba ignava]
MSLININTSEKEKQEELEEKSEEEETKSNAKIAIKKAQKVAAILLTAIGFDEYGGTLVYPFVPKMLKKRFHISKKNVGVLSGVIEGSFKASSFFSCFYLGYFSDKFGRKPIIIFSLFMVSITLLLFGFAWSVPLLIILQVIAGLTDGSEVVTKAVFSDLTSGVLNNYRSFLFAAMSACYAFFRGLSSATVSIFFGHDFGVESFKKNPYLFPCIIGAIIVFIVAIITYIFFSDKGLMPKEVEPFVHKFKNLKEGFKYVWANRLLRKLVIVFSLCDFSNGSVFVLMILYATLDYSEGGLGFSPNETGVIFIVFGIGTTIYELLWYNKLVKKIGVRKLFLLGSLVTAVCASMFPNFTINNRSFGITCNMEMGCFLNLYSSLLLWNDVFALKRSYND